MTAYEAQLLRGGAWRSIRASVCWWCRSCRSGSKILREDHRPARSGVQADTDDLRDAPAITLAHRLHELGAKVRAYDPHAAVKASRLAPSLAISPDVEHLAQDADALVLVTDWPEFRELPFGDLACRMRSPLIVDGRNSLDREQVIAGGFEYLGIGR